MTSGTDEATFKVENGNTGVITLNRPKALNALSLPMIRGIHPKLKEWTEKDEIKMVLIEGSGPKAFCAGGDIRAITEAKGSKTQADFFKEEYYLNNAIGTLPIPYVALIHGITMGGGVGLSVHGRYRVCSEKTVFAMPETGIGLVPDVGGAYFLPRLQGQLGMFLALTGHRLKGADVLHAGIATHGCSAETFPTLKSELIALPSKSEADLESVLNRHSDLFKAAQPAFTLENDMGKIDKCFAGDSVAEIMTSLKKEGVWGEKQAGIIAKMSPTSVGVAFRQLREGEKKSSLAECLAMEYRLVRRCCEDKDFYEGVRAVLVDRDNAPKWEPSSLEELTQGQVDKYFEPLQDGTDLKF